MMSVRLFATSVAVCIPFASASAQSTSASSAGPAPTVAPANAKPAQNPDRVICRTESETGSLTARKKTCMTAAQWKDMAFRSGQWIEHQTTYNSRPNGQ